LREFPEEVRQVVGFALYEAQRGSKHPSAKPLKRHKGAGVLEIIDDYDGDTYRAIYTVRYPHTIYVLHSFQKKSKKGTATPRHHLDVIEARLKSADQHHNERLKNPKGKSE
jgi:phage-related protein